MDAGVKSNEEVCSSAPNGPDKEMKEELDDNNVIIIDLKQQIQDLCEQKISNRSFNPSQETVTVWKTIIRIATDYPNILKHPDLKSLYHLFLLLGIRLESEDNYNICIPIGDQSMLEIQEETSVNKLDDRFSKTKDNASNGTLSTMGINHPVQLIFGEIEDIEYHLELRMAIIKKYTLMPSIKTHVSRILPFLLTQPRQLYTSECAFIMDFLKLFGVENAHIKMFVNLVSSSNVTRTKYGWKRHQLISMWLNGQLKPARKRIRNGNLKKYKKKVVMNELNNNDCDKNGSETFDESDDLRKLLLTRLTAENGSAYPGPIDSPHNSHLDPQSNDDSEDTSSEEGFSGKRKHRQRFQIRAHKKARVQYPSSTAHLSLHPGSRFRACKTSNTKDATLVPNNPLTGPANEINSPLRLRARRSDGKAAILPVQTGQIQGETSSRRQIENDQKPIACPSSAGCPVRFLYKSTMQKHFSRRHSNEVPPAEIIVFQNRRSRRSGIETEIGETMPMQRGNRYSIQNDKKPIGCPSSTGCNVRFMYDTTMMKHFRTQHPEEVLLDSNNLTSATTASSSITGDKIKAEDSNHLVENQNGTANQSSVKKKKKSSARRMRNW